MGARQNVQIETHSSICQEGKSHEQRISQHHSEWDMINITLPPTAEVGFELDTCKDIEIPPGPWGADVPNTLTQPLFFLYPNIEHHFSRVPVPPNRTPVSSSHNKLIPLARRTVRFMCEERHLGHVW
jgi:hypothetical protein